MKSMTSEARTLRALRTLVREVMHPAIEKAKAQSTASGIPADVVSAAHPSVSSAGQGTGGGQKPPGVMAPKAPVQDTAAKSKTTETGVQGYRVASGSRKGTAIGHKGDKTIVKWDDDGTTSQEPGSALSDLKEYVRLCFERLDTLVVDLEAPGPAGTSDKPHITRERCGDITTPPLDPVDDVEEFDPGDDDGHHELAGPTQR